MVNANIGQQLFVGIAGQELDPATRRWLQKIQPGGIVLFARNVEAAGQLRALTRDLRMSLALPPLIAIDQENQRVNRLRSIGGDLPQIAEIKKDGCLEQASAFGKSVGQGLHDLGINLDFAPVLDLELFDGAVDNALRNRCWGRTLDEVSDWAGAFIEGLTAGGVGACAKHFPGLGASHQDSHEALPTITRSREKLIAEDILPFRQLKNRLAAIMVSHGHFTAFDGDVPRPASLSRTIIEDVLRRQVGYDGVVVTDDMEMGAIVRSGSFTDAVVESVRAGTDMVLICHSVEKIQAAHEALVKAVETGRLDFRQLALSRARIEKLQGQLT